MIEQEEMIGSVPEDFSPSGDYIIYGHVPGMGPDQVWYVLTPEERHPSEGMERLVLADFIVTSEGKIVKSRYGRLNIGEPANHEYMERALQVYELLGESQSTVSVH
jgi:hypothetical protein